MSKGFLGGPNSRGIVSFSSEPWVGDCFEYDDDTGGEWITTPVKDIETDGGRTRFWTTSGSEYVLEVIMPLRVLQGGKA